ncbi:MAG: S-layer homology domain-containing protein [Veillonella sp.]|nr:S-layer homology domain-containing protein [Veillonella sp.]
MKKRFAAIFAATAVLGVTTAFAANPFSDVTPQDWAYQSVAQLAAAGVINGYPDGTFKGQNNITRYEMAQMVAKAMANEARANAEQQAMINRLADEFSSELNNLGVRVSNLENKVGNVKVTGDARLRYKGSDKKEMFATDTNPNKKSKFDYRGRVQFNATVADNTSAVVRITTDDTEFGDATTNTVTFDRVYVAHNFGKNVTGMVGRYGVDVGNGLVYSDTFDGATLAYGSDNFNASATYGSFVKGHLFNKDDKYYFNVEDQDADNNLTATVLQANGKLGEHVTLGGFYVFGNKNLNNDIYGGSLDLNFNKLWIGGEYATFADDNKKTVDGALIPKNGDKDAWVAGIGYGDYDITKAGTWDIKAQYFNLGVVSPVISSTWVQPYHADYKAWMATVDYALAKNVGLSAYATFNAKTNPTEGKSKDLPELYRAELNFQF